MNKRIILPLDQVGLADHALVGGKCASLGEMIQNLSSLGIAIPGGFVITTDAYWQFLEQSHLRCIKRLFLLYYMQFENFTFKLHGFGLFFVIFESKTFI